MRGAESQCLPRLTPDVTQRFWYAPKLAHVVKIVTERGNFTYVQAAFPGHIEVVAVTVP